MVTKLDCPECGEEDVIKAKKKTNHSSRSKYSGGVTFRLISEECESCGFSDLKQKLKRKGFNIK